MSNIATNNLFNRRWFIGQTSLALAAVSSTPLMALAAHPHSSITVGDIMDKFIAEVTDQPFANTVDTLKAGNRSIEVKGIVTTMFATINIINKAIAARANFIIAHEPTFYNHLDETAWLANDEVYKYKRDLLEKNNIAVWRNHDYIHTHKPDGVVTKVVEQLGWQSYFDMSSRIATIPSTTLKQLIEHAKKQLGIRSTRYIGNLDQQCKRVLVMPGAAGGRRQIESLIATKPDVLMCGEIQEWETAEYVRDANAKGQKLGLIVLGHIDSEEPGSEYMAQWLKKNFAAIPVTHMPAENALHFL